MTQILDIASGIVVAAIMLGFLSLGMKLIFWQSDSDSEGIRALGWVVLAVALSATFWLVFVRTGAVACPPDWAAKLPLAICPSASLHRV